MAKYTAIVLSAGNGSRMKSEIPKQYMLLSGKPVLYYSLKAFEKSEVDDIILVCAEKDIEYCKNNIVDRYGIKKVKTIVSGGDERYKSVYEGLKAAKGTDYVLIHDGARPIINAEIISNSINTVTQKGACVVGVPVKDTIKIADDSGYVIKTPERHTLWQIQTPQSFMYKKLVEAYEIIQKDIIMGNEEVSITDDAVILEYATSEKVLIIRGEYENIKITTPEDMELAALFLQRNRN